MGIGSHTIHWELCGSGCTKKGTPTPSWYVFQICVCDYHIPTARAPVRGAATRRRIYRFYTFVRWWDTTPRCTKKRVAGVTSGHHPLGRRRPAGAARAPCLLRKGAVSPWCTVHQDGVTPASERRPYTILWVVFLVVGVRVGLGPPGGK